MFNSNRLTAGLVSLNYGNHQLWSKKLRKLLDFLELVDHLNEKINEQDNDWDSNDKEVKEIMLNMVDNKLKEKINENESAYQIWCKLEDLCLNHNSDERLIKQFFSIKLNKTSEENLDQSFEELEKIGEQTLPLKIIIGDPKSLSIRFISDVIPLECQQKFIDEIDDLNNVENVKKKIKEYLGFSVQVDKDESTIQIPASSSEELNSVIIEDKAIGDDKISYDENDNQINTQDSGIQNEIESLIDKKSDDQFDQLDQPASYKDKAYILDSSKMVSGSPNSTTNNEIVTQDIRFMKQEDIEKNLEATKPTSTIPTSNNNFLGNKAKNSNRRNSPNGRKRKSDRRNSRDRKNRNESLNNSGSFRRSNENLSENFSDTTKQDQEIVNPYLVNNYASIELFKKLQATSTIQTCNEMLNSNLTRPTGLNQHSN